MSAQTITKIPNFKAEIVSMPMSNDRRHTPPVPDNYYEDAFELQSAPMINDSLRKAEKRERSRDNWNKAGVVASCGIALTMLTTLIVGAIALFAKGAGKDGYTTAKVIWEDFKGTKKVAEIIDATTSKTTMHVAPSTTAV